MFRFTIRDVLWLTVVTGLSVGWWTQTTNLQKELASWKHRATAVKGVLVWRGWEVDWDNDAVMFENRDQRISCPPPKSAENYVWHFVKSPAAK